METILPRTCVVCHGRGYIFQGNSEDWDVTACDACDDEAGANYLLAADAYDEIEMKMEENDEELTKCQGCGEPSMLDELDLDLLCDYCAE